MTTIFHVQYDTYVVRTRARILYSYSFFNGTYRNDLYCDFLNRPFDRRGHVRLPLRVRYGYGRCAAAAVPAD